MLLLFYLNAYTNHGLHTMKKKGMDHQRLSLSLSKIVHIGVRKGRGGKGYFLGRGRW